MAWGKNFKISKTWTAVSILIAIVSSSIWTNPSFSADGILDSSSPNTVIVPASQDAVSVNFSIPGSIVLGSGSTVSWAVTDIRAQDALGNQAIQYPGAEQVESRSIGGTPTNGFQYSLQSIGRRATLSALSYFAGTYSISILGTVQGENFSNTTVLIFEENSNRVPMTYINGVPPSIIIDSPDVGQDLQTTVRYKIAWTYPGAGAIGSVGPLWVQMEVVDASGRVIPQPEAVGVYTQSGGTELNQALPTGTDWISLSVSYQNWLKWGGVHILVWWSLETPDHEKAISFAKTFDIPINFPSPKPYLSSSCQDVRLESQTYCSISLSYKDALGNAASGQPQDISWTLKSGNNLIRSGISAQVANGSNFQVPLSKGASALTLNANIVGSATSSSAVAYAHNYQEDIAKTLRLSSICPSTFTSKLFGCTIGVSSATSSATSFVVVAQERVNGKSWINEGTYTLRLGETASIKLPNPNNKSLDVRATTNFLGKSYFSPVHSWITSSPVPTTSPIKSGSGTSTAYKTAFKLMVKLANSTPSPFSAARIQELGGVDAYCSKFELAGESSAGVRLSASRKFDVILACKDYLNSINIR